jgi:hypothetical protein
VDAARRKAAEELDGARDPGDEWPAATDEALRPSVAFLRALDAQGRVIEGGWLALKALWLDPASPPDQVKDLRWAYMAGAEHLFTSIMVIMDDYIEPTEADLQRVDRIASELEAFRQEMQASLPTEGRA